MILANNITLSYDGQRNIIQNASFSKINYGDFVFITGASGSGKSTLLKSFYSDIKLKGGNLLVNKHKLLNIPNSKLKSLRKSIGIIFQDYKLIKEYTVEENIMLPLKLNGYSDKLSLGQAQKLLKHVKLDKKGKYYPDQLSGGEQQRVSVARALSHNPKLILADEPTGNLDDVSANIIWGLLKKANEQLGITIVVVTHRIPENFGLTFRKFDISGGEIYES
ncbi:MAG: ATP-binding cassette domain-containing protein [Arcobacteraceae bacterium]|nr:ATP-binding cassette domain-containing protein [Arcobacteraceae bacterium]